MSTSAPSPSTHQPRQHIFDPGLEKTPYGSCLIIGRYAKKKVFFQQVSFKKIKTKKQKTNKAFTRIFYRSGTGKSTLLKHIVSRLRPAKPLYLINVRGDEVQHYTKIHKKHFCITFGSLKSIKKNSMIVIEDIITMNKAEEDQLRHTINYTAHHKLAKLFCVTHTIYKTGVFSMMPLFHSIIFTSSASNTPIIRSVFGFFKIDKDKASAWLASFKAWSKHLNSQKAYFYFDCTSMSFCVSTNMLLPGTSKILGSLHSNDTDGDDCHESMTKSVPLDQNSLKNLSFSKAAKHQTNENMKQKFAAFFQNHPFQGQALAIFCTILEKFSSSKINPIDLTICFKTKRGGGKRRHLSTVDYIAELLAPGGTAREENLVLHNYISKVCVIPRSCIRNTAFLKNRSFP